jgi:ribA/ribD-fused uncharacterized protein
MPIFPADIPEDALFLSRADENHLLGTYIHYSFNLEGSAWPTVEHYYQGMKFLDTGKQGQIRNAPTPQKARALGRKRDKSFRKDWQRLREVIMTRAVYTRCKTYPLLATALLDTGERRIIENSNYDYFWGCGRDKRGNNAYGKVLMNVRKRLRKEIDEAENQ